MMGDSTIFADGESIWTYKPALKQYTYLKFKGQVLIINPMTGKIVDIFPEA